MTQEDRRWAEVAADLEFESLSTIRGLAEKWAASLTAGLGVVGLAALLESVDKFNKLGSPEKTIAQVSFTVAIVLALLASGFAIAAAQGTAKHAFIPGGAALREYSIEAVDNALRWLKFSRVLALIAVMAVLVAGYCLWFGDRAKGSATVIELPADSQFCSGGSAAEDSDANYVVRCGD
jgi:hypothetical protein